MNWLLLIIAGLFEAVFAFCLGKARLTTGAEMGWWYMGFVVALTLSMTLLMKATQTLPIGTAYAVWTGIGAVGTAFLGMLLFGESREAARLACIALIVAGIVGLKLVTPDSGG